MKCQISAGIPAVSDVLIVALRRTAADLDSPRAPEVVDDIIREATGTDHHDEK